MTDQKKIKSIFVQGAIPASHIAEQIERHQAITDIGAHQIFLGQVRADRIDGKAVVAIDYSAYEEMALEKVREIREVIFEKYPIRCLHMYHSLGRVKAGEISLCVIASSAHRQAAIDACAEVVERIKAGLPVWGKEILDTDEYRWKENP